MPNGPTLPPCPDPNYELLCPETGEVRPAGCRRLRCPECLPSLAWRRGLAIAWSRPDRFITLTKVGDDWTTIRARAKRLRYELAKSGKFEWVWSIERNPAGTGHHLHAYQRGQYVPQARLSAVAARCGMGVVADIRMAYRGSERSSGYFLKSVGYQLKATTADGDEAEAFIRINGGRLTHQSRGYFGCPARTAEQRAVAESRSPDEPRWVLIKASHAGRLGAAGVDWY